MNKLIVIGASTGGFEAIKQVTAALPADLDAAVFIVWHVSPDVRGLLPTIITKNALLKAANAVDKEPIQKGRIYTAPPDWHLIIDRETVRISHGPKENRFRPAIDPLFRSAAYAYGPRVIGIILSGGLDEGSAGLWTIKQRGGTVIVQDPEEADVPSMPENALRAVNADYTVKVAEIAPLLVRLCNALSPELNSIGKEEENEKLRREIQIALQTEEVEKGVMDLGELSPYSCPECQGVLTSIKEGNQIRFRCHTGHAFSADVLLAALTERIEESLWSAIRGVEESVLLLNHMGDHFAEVNNGALAAVYFNKAKEAEARIKQVRRVVLSHEQLSAETIKMQAEMADN